MHIAQAPPTTTPVEQVVALLHALRLKVNLTPGYDALAQSCTGQEVPVGMDERPTRTGTQSEIVYKEQK